MFRISALNDEEVPEDNDSAVLQVPAQQLQESQILTRYNEALASQRKGDVNEAIEVYKQLLETSYLSKAEPVENSQDPTSNGVSPIYGKTDLNIKYSCFRNLAEISRDLGKLSLALNYFLSALEIDGTDVTTWYKVGIIASKLGLIHLASTAFLRGIKCSSQNWSCLDRAAISLVVEGDYPLAMDVLSSCFKINPDYQRGLALRDIMLETESWLKTDMALLCPQANLQFDRPFDGPEEVREKLRTEIKTLQNNFQLWKKREAEKPIVYVELVEPMEELSWRAMGEAFIALYKWFEESNESILQRRVNLLTSLPGSNTKAAATDGVASVVEEPMDVEPCEKKDSVVDAEEQEMEVTEEKRSRRRTGSALMEELLLSGKRRSTRVRTCRKEQESMSVADALTNILPRCLLHKVSVTKKMVANLDEESMDTMDLYKLFEKQVVTDQENVTQDELKEEEKVDHDNLAQIEGYFSTLQEEDDVKVFLETQDKETFLEILKAYVLTMEKFWTKTWPKKLVPVFIECYQAFRKYYGISPQFLDSTEIRQHTYEESGATLLYHELMIDCDKCGEDTLPLHLMHNIVELACYPNEFPDALSHAIYELRIMWMRAQLFMTRGETSEAIYYFETALNCYTDHFELENRTVHLRNCVRNQIISKEVVLGALDRQSRKKSLSEIVRLYNEGSYKEVADTLRDHVNFVANSADDFLGRKKLMNMLINTLYHLDEYKECLFWLETSIYELLNNTRRNSLEDEEAQEWKVSFDQLLVAIDECCEWGEFTIYDGLPKGRLPRFVQTLCQAICRQLEDSERPPSASRPWMTLNRILVAMEADESSKATTKTFLDNSGQGEDSDDENDTNDIPPSILLLFTAHEYLGRREWCNCDGNVLLFLIMDQVIPRLRNPEWISFRETVQQYLDQVVFCLYAHPSKKTKTRYIVDHYVSPIPLSWDRAIQLFELYRPDQMPSFDSLRTTLISPDTEVLFRRIVSLIPEEINPEENAQYVEDFIYKRREDIPQTSVKLPQQVIDIFYILGDYHFKTHDRTTALKHLLVDLSFNSHRFDAWASVALSKVSDLESSLNSCDPLENYEFLEEAMAAIRCYEHSMSLDKSVCSLWIEYGHFAYTVHSFCSQRMKLESESLSLEQFEEIETTKIKMLEVAKEAFLNANNIWSKSNDEDTQDERWLHYYMLGKIGEKSGDLTYLQYYEKASDLLYENNAQYPKKISYNTPQTLSIEAMEIYYRAHVCVIKCLELHDGEPLDEKTREMFVKFLKKFANGPFAKQLSKSDLMKQKSKELDAVEQAKNREVQIIRNLVSSVISDVERKEHAEKVEVQKMVDSLVLEIIDESVTDGFSDLEEGEILPEPNQLTTSAVREEFTATKMDVVPVEEEMDIDPQLGNGIGCDEVDTIRKSVDTIRKSVDSQTSAKVDSPADSSAVECIELSSDEKDEMLSKDDLDNEMLKLAASVAEGEGEVVKPAKLNVLDCAPVGYASSAALPPNMPVECLEYYQQPVFEPYPHEQVPEDNYYYTLDDLKGPSTKVKSKSKTIKPGSAKKRRKVCREKVSSSSDSDDNIAYADDSSARSVSPSSSSSEETSQEEENRKRKKRPCRPPQQQVATKADDSIQNDFHETSIMASTPVNSVPAAPPGPEELLLQQCISAFELCAIRFPQHYKSVYRLAHFFYRSKKHRDLEKCRQLLLGSYVSAFGNIGGLFAENKTTHFFNGIWRLPAPDVDRPGSFASHMSRSVMLLLEVLRDLRDHKLLLQLCLQLRKVPEPEKKYLREDERLPLSKQALTLSLQSLRNTVKYADVMTLPIVLDAYRVYLRVQKHCPSKEGAFGDCLRDAFNRLGKGKTSLEQCLKFCQGELTGNRMAFPSQSPNSFKPKMKRTRKARDAETKPSSGKPAPPKAPSPPSNEAVNAPDDKDSGYDLSVTEKDKDIPACDLVLNTKDAKLSEAEIETETAASPETGRAQELAPDSELAAQLPPISLKKLPGISMLPAIDLSHSVAEVMGTQSNNEPKTITSQLGPVDSVAEVTKTQSSNELKTIISKLGPVDTGKDQDMKLKSKLPEISALTAIDLSQSVAEVMKSQSNTEPKGIITKAMAVETGKEPGTKLKTSSQTIASAAANVAGQNSAPSSSVSSKKTENSSAKPTSSSTKPLGSSSKPLSSSVKSASSLSASLTNDVLNSYLQKYAAGSNFLGMPTTQPFFGLPNLMAATNEVYNNQFKYMANCISQLQSQILADNPVNQRKKQAAPPAAHISSTTSPSAKTSSISKPYQDKPRQSQKSSFLPPSMPKESVPRAHSSKPSLPSPSAGPPMVPNISSLFKPQVYPKPTSKDKFSKIPSNPSTALSDPKRSSFVHPKHAELVQPSSKPASASSDPKRTSIGVPKLAEPVQPSSKPASSSSDPKRTSIGVPNLAESVQPSSNPATIFSDSKRTSFGHPKHAEPVQPSSKPASSFSDPKRLSFGVPKPVQLSSNPATIFSEPKRTSIGVTKPAEPVQPSSKPAFSFSDPKRPSYVVPKPAEPAKPSSLGKFNIDEILKKNPGITITHKKAENQSVAMNLSSKSSSEAGEGPDIEEIKKPKRSAPEIVILDD